MHVVLMTHHMTNNNSAAEDQEEVGWKYLHGDVFRPPPQLELFSAAIGTGAQVFAMAVFIFALALIGVFYPYNRGSLLASCVVRVVCSCAAGRPGEQQGVCVCIHVHACA